MGIGQYYRCSVSNLVCLATIGVAFFSAVTSVAALFYFRRDNEQRFFCITPKRTHSTPKDIAIIRRDSIPNISLADKENGASL